MSENKLIACLMTAAAAALLTAGCSQQLMPTPNLYAGSKSNPFADVPPALQKSDVDVLFVTDRLETTDKNGNPDFGYDRSRSLTFGSYIVGIGENVSWEDLVRESRTQSRKTSLPLSRKDIRVVGRLPETPALVVNAEGMLIDDPAIADQNRKLRDDFCAEISRRLAENPTQKEAFIFIHGFNNTMDDAAFTIAEVWHFAGRRGIPIAYTWPAGKGYAYDRESGEFTIFHLKQFLRGLAFCPGLERINIIAHSRGTDVATTALRELAIEYNSAGKNPQKELKLGNLVLCAADLDIDVVSQRLVAEKIPVVPERLTIYVSETDKALGAADWLFDSRERLGRIRFAEIKAAQQKNLVDLANRLQIIDAKVSSDGIGHAYFHTNPAVSSDLILILRDNKQPGAENGRPLRHPPNGFWEITDDYLRPGTH